MPEGTLRILQENESFPAMESPEMQTNETPELPVDNPVTLVEETPQEKIVETPKEEIKEPAKPIEQPAAEIKPEKPQEAPKKEYDPLSELGFTEEKDRKYFTQFMEAYKKGPEAVYELYEKSTKDYNKLSDSQVLELKLQKEYPGVEKDDLDFLIAAELEKYGINGEDDEADAKGKRLLSIQLKKVREELQAEQQNYKATAFEHKPTPEQIQAQKDWEEFNGHLDSHNDFAEFGRNRGVSFGEFKAEVPADLDPKLMAKDPSAFFGQFYDEKTKTFDAGKFIKTALFAQNPDKYASDLIAYGKSLATKQHHDELRGTEGGRTHAAPAQTDKPKLRIIN